MEKILIKDCPLPWQQSQWQRLTDRANQEKLPHALLLIGTEGLGKLLFAKAFSQLLLCQSGASNGIACGKCKSCRLFKSDTHPDFKIISPEEKGKAIKIDQIRSLLTFVNQTKHQSLYQIVIVSPADSMNLSSANALLKILEEPPSEKALFILTSDQLHQIPLTVRSRCQLISFGIDYTQSLQWLKEKGHDDTSMDLILAYTHGSPFLAMDLIENDEWTKEQTIARELLRLIKGEENPIALASRFEKEDFDRYLKSLMFWISEFIRVRSNIKSQYIDDQQYKAIYNITSKRLSLELLFKYFSFLLEVKKAQNSRLNLNKTLIMEDFFIQIYKDCQQ